jgi:putative flippase GtrA
MAGDASCMRAVAARSADEAVHAPAGGGRVIVAIRYVAFAIVSMITNLATQEIVFRLSPPYALALAIAAGTVTGFAAKYVLDKFWIFDDRYGGPAGELRKLVRYGAFSVLTTQFFWGFEVACWLIWQTDTAKYVGAVIGSSIGYAVKYLLDRSFVFNQRAGVPSGRVDAGRPHGKRGCP